MLVTTTALAINQTMYRKLEFSLDQFVPVAISASSAESLSVHPGKVAGGLREFLTAAKDREITFATAGVGSGSHLAAEYFFKTMAKVRAVHVPFRGGAPAVQAAINAIVSDKAEQERLAKVGYQITPRSAPETREYLKSEAEKWGVMVRTVGVYVD